MTAATRQLPRWGLRIAAAIIASLLLAAVFADWLAPYPADHADLARALEPPSSDHWLGTDEDGADLLSLVIYGARIAVWAGFGTVAVSVLLGLLVGSISGYYGGWVDEIAMRFVEVLLSFPGILLAILIIFISANPSVWTVIGALSATGWASYARLVRGQVLSLRTRDFVAALKITGLSDAKIMWAHIVPNAMGPVVVQATFGVAGAILAESSLSFLGLGPADAPSWGRVLDQGAVLFIKSPYVALSAGLAIAVTVLAVNVVGDALRLALDPRLSRS